jgi:hypothetical protein
MKPQNPAPPSESNLIEAEMQHNIPVQSHSSDNKNPIATVKQFIEHNHKEDADLDKVLDDVNKSVKDSDKKPDKKTFLSFFKEKYGKKQAEPINSHVSHTAVPATSQKAAPSKLEDKLGKKEAKPKTPKPLVAVVIAVGVATALSVAAFSAFSHSKGSTNNQSAAATASKVQGADTSPELSTNDLKDLSSTLQSNFNSLNDEKDFNSADLDDAALGL